MVDLYIGKRIDSKYMLNSSGLTKFISASRIVHRIPGRIRMHIPILEKLPARWLIFSDPTAELIKMRNGIEDVKIQPLTGSLTIHYAPDVIEEIDIIKWLKVLVYTFLNIQIRSKSMNEADIRLRFALISNRLSRNGAAQHIT